MFKISIFKAATVFTHFFVNLLHQKPADEKPESDDKADSDGGSKDGADDTYDANDDDDVKWLQKCAYPPHSKGKPPTFRGNQANMTVVIF